MPRPPSALATPGSKLGVAYVLGEQGSQTRTRVSIHWQRMGIMVPRGVEFPKLLSGMILQGLVDSVHIL